MNFIYSPHTTFDAPFDKERCKSTVHEEGRGVGHYQCTRRPWKDGWCKQHHPDSVAKREEQTRTLYEEQRERRNRPYKRILELQVFAYDVAHEAHMMGRCYSKGDEKISPTNEYQRVDDMVARRIGVTFETLGKNGKEN